jgi:hypothetical protein
VFLDIKQRAGIDINTIKSSNVDLNLNLDKLELQRLTVAIPKLRKIPIKRGTVTGEYHVNYNLTTKKGEVNAKGVLSKAQFRENKHITLNHSFSGSFSSQEIKSNATELSLFQRGVLLAHVNIHGVFANLGGVRKGDINLKSSFLDIEKLKQLMKQSSKRTTSTQSDTPTPRNKKRDVPTKNSKNNPLKKLDLHLNFALDKIKYSPKVMAKTKGELVLRYGNLTVIESNSLVNGYPLALKGQVDLLNLKKSPYDLTASGGNIPFTLFESFVKDKDIMNRIKNGKLRKFDIQLKGVGVSKDEIMKNLVSRTYVEIEHLVVPTKAMKTNEYARLFAIPLRLLSSLKMAKISRYSNFISGAEQLLNGERDFKLDTLTAELLTSDGEFYLKSLNGVGSQLINKLTAVAVIRKDGKLQLKGNMVVGPLTLPIIATGTLSAPNLDYTATATAFLKSNANLLSDPKKLLDLLKNKKKGETIEKEKKKGDDKKKKKRSKKERKRERREKLIKGLFDILG